MSTERLFLVDPYNEKHIELVEEFEKRNSLETKTSDFLRKLLTTFSKEEYLEQKKSSNEIEESLFIERDSKITDTCHIQGEKDIKTCRITFAPLETKKRKLLTLAADYALNTLGMQEVFINVSENDKNMIENLRNQGFEDLGEESGVIVFLKEKEDEKLQTQRKVA